MAENSEQARDEIGTFILPFWNTASANAPLAFDNKSFDRPYTPALWGRLHIIHYQGSRASLGPNARFRNPGRIFIQVFAPVGTGMNSLNQVSTALKEAFEDAGSVGNIWFRDAGAREVGTDGDYYQVNVEVDFTYDRVT
jgi:hypothetical protein